MASQDVEKFGKFFQEFNKNLKMQKQTLEEGYQLLADKTQEVQQNSVGDVNAVRRYEKAVATFKKQIKPMEQHLQEAVAALMADMQTMVASIHQQTTSSVVNGVRTSKTTRSYF